MNACLRIPVIAVAAVIVSCWTAAAQQSTFHKPMAPIGPTSDAQCQALESEWGAVCQRISDTHQQCLDANASSTIPRAGSCSKAPCLALHIENDSCGGAERRDAVNACWTSVRAHKARDAEFKAAQDAALRAQQQAERERRDRFAAEAAKANMEADAARRRKADYVRNTPRPGTTGPGLDGRQASIVADLRSEAERNSARLTRPLPGPAPRSAGPPPPYEAIENDTMAAWATPLEYLDYLAKVLKNPMLKLSGEVLGWFGAIHDGRRAEAEAARDRFNVAFRRDRPNDVTFKPDDCYRFPAYCDRVFAQVSVETIRLHEEYKEKRRRYSAWTDLGNITGNGWTKDEQAKFAMSVSKTLGKKAFDKLVEWSKEPNWDKPDREDRSWVQDAANKNLKKGLDQYFPPPAPRGILPPAPSRNLPDEAAEMLREWERKRKMPQRSEPDWLQELLKQATPMPIPSPPPSVSIQPRG